MMAKHTGVSCFTKALSVLTLAFFKGETAGPIQVMKAKWVTVDLVGTQTYP